MTNTGVASPTDGAPNVSAGAARPFEPERWRPRASVLLGWAMLDWACIALAWWAMSRSDALVVDIVAVLVVAGRLHALGGILHDACHRPQGRTSLPWLAVEALAGWPIASTTDAMRYHHLRHHRWSNTPRDPYRRPSVGGRPLPFTLLCLRGLLLPAWWTLRAPFGTLAALLPRLRGPYARAFLQDRGPRDPGGDPAVLRCARAESRQLLAHASVLALALALDWPLLMTFLVPLHVAGVLNATRLALEHTGETHERPTLRNVVATTRTRTLGRLGDWLLYPHNLGLHLEHHLYPGVAFQHLPKVRELTRRRVAAVPAPASDGEPLKG